MTVVDAPTLAAMSAPAGALAYVRTVPAPFVPPPPATVGALGWTRSNLFPNVGSGVLTVLIALLLVWVVPPLIDFLLIDAVWSGADREACADGGAHPQVELVGTDLAARLLRERGERNEECGDEREGAREEVPAELSSAHRD